MVALRHLDAEPLREPAFLSDPEKVREERRELREARLIEEEDFAAREPVREGSDDGEFV